MSKLWAELGGVTYKWSGVPVEQLRSFESTKPRTGEVRFIPIRGSLGGGRLFYVSYWTRKPGLLVDDLIFEDAPPNTKYRVGWCLVDNANSEDQIQELKQEIFGYD